MEHKTERAGELLLQEIAVLPEKDFRKVNMTGVMGVIAMEITARHAKEDADKIKQRNELEEE